MKKRRAREQVEETDVVVTIRKGVNQIGDVACSFLRFTCATAAVAALGLAPTSSPSSVCVQGKVRVVVRVVINFEALRWKGMR